MDSDVMVNSGDIVSGRRLLTEEERMKMDGDVMMNSGMRRNHVGEHAGRLRLKRHRACAKKGVGGSAGRTTVA
ncbi:hypothetical protein [Candidatus Solincola sp.]|nr:hypothetical protein [Actinomycetota bacterium]MDI7252490.1 hypothetical protein [Actinomycetota bacterium]